jgi:hypothetical protein
MQKLVRVMAAAVPVILLGRIVMAASGEGGSPAAPALRQIPGVSSSSR